MSRIILLGIVTFLLLSTAATRIASAHHEAWVLRDSGSQCAFTQPRSGWDDNYYDGLFNGATFKRWMSCPVSLAARWGSSSPAPTYGTALWGNASAAAIYVINNQPGTAFSCQVQARVASGGLRFSRVASTTAGGEQRLMPNTASNWGGTFEAAKAEKLTSLEFLCEVPTNYSGVYGYKVRMCIRNGGCVPNGDAGEGPGSTAGGAAEDSVQASGITCMTSGENTLVRSELGAKNVGSEYVSVFCPVPPPADDTNEVQSRKIAQLTVKYRGKTRLSDELPPSCNLLARTRDYSNPQNVVTEMRGSETFVKELDWEAVTLTNIPLGVGYDGSSRTDISLSVACDLPPGYTIQGVIGRVKIPAVSPGF